MAVRAEHNVQEAQLLQAVQQLKGDVSKDHLAYCNNSCLQRYLRARQGNVKKAAKMLANTLSWREKNHVDGLRQSDFSAEIHSGRMYIAGADSEGRPVFVLRKRAERSDAAQNARTLNFMMLTLEAGARVADAGAADHKWTWIMDMAGYSRANSPPLSVSIATIEMFLDHYPERLHRCFLVDAPTVFHLAYRAMMPFIDARTKEKIIFVNSKDLPPLPHAGGAAAPTGGKSSKACVASFLPYQPFYAAGYDEQQYRTLLSKLGL